MYRGLDAGEASIAANRRVGHTLTMFMERANTDKIESALKAKLGFITKREYEPVFIALRALEAKV